MWTHTRTQQYICDYIQYLPRYIHSLSLFMPPTYSLSLSLTLTHTHTLTRMPRHRNPHTCLNICTPHTKHTHTHTHTHTLYIHTELTDTRTGTKHNQLTWFS